MAAVGDPQPPAPCTESTRICVSGDPELRRFRTTVRGIWPVGRAGTVASLGWVRGQLANSGQR
eukprot:15447723-Alexandrium_andersonii.AAC.1